MLGRATVLGDFVQKLMDLKSTVARYKVFESFCFVFVCFRMYLSALVCLTAPGAFERLTRVILAQNSSAPWSLCLKSPASIYLLILSTQCLFTAYTGSGNNVCFYFKAGEAS